MLGRLFDYLLHVPADCEPRVAWIDEQDRTWTWLEVRIRTLAVIEWLSDQGIRSGDRIVNATPNSLAWALLDLGCSALNAIHVPLDPRLSLAAMEAATRSVAPKLVFAQGDLGGICSLPIDGLISLPTPSHESHRDKAWDPDDVATILFTSGTSGSSKGLMLSHRNLVSNAIAKLDAMPQTAGDVRLNVLPFAHAYARTCELSTWVMSYSTMATASGIDDWFRRAPAVRPTLVNSVPLFYDRCWKLCTAAAPSVTEQDYLRTLLGGRMRRVASGGAAVSLSIRRWFADLGLPIYQGYGLTETSPVVCSNREGTDQTPAILDGVGPTVHGMEVQLDGENRIWVRGAGVMRGYWNNPQETRLRIREGWLDTGDAGKWIVDHETSRSSLEIIGRLDDAIQLSNGYQVYPTVIERRLIEQGIVTDGLLVGQGRPYLVLIAKVASTTPNCDEAGHEERESSLLSVVRDQLSDCAAYEKPKRVAIVGDDWDATNGLMSFKGSKRRGALEAFYRPLIERLYRDAY